MNFNSGQLIRVKNSYVHEYEPNVGVVIDSIYAREHSLRAVRDCAETPENQNLQVVKIMFCDNIVREFFDDELEEVSNV